MQSGFGCSSASNGLPDAWRLTVAALAVFALTVFVMEPAFAAMSAPVVLPKDLLKGALREIQGFDPNGFFIPTADNSMSMLPPAPPASNNDVSTTVGTSMAWIRSSCFYCQYVAAIYGVMDQVGTRTASSLASGGKQLALAFACVWVQWQILKAVVPFGSGPDFKRLASGVAGIVLSLLVLNSFGSDGGPVKRYIYSPIITAGTTLAEGAMANASLGGNANCSSGQGNLGARIACSSYKSAEGATTAIAIGVSIMTRPSSGFLPAFGAAIINAITGLLLVLLWAGVLLWFPVVAVIFSAKAAILFAFSPLVIMAAPYVSARDVVQKSLRMLVATAVQMVGLGMSGAAMSSLITLAIQQSSFGSAENLIRQTTAGTSAGIGLTDQLYWVLVAGAALSIAVLAVTTHILRQMVGSDGMTSEGGIAKAGAAFAGGALGAAAGAQIAGPGGVLERTVASSTRTQQLIAAFGGGNMVSRAQMNVSRNRGRDRDDGPPQPPT